MNQLEQLQRWVDGEPVHTPTSCTPDFACCVPELLAPVEVRKAFADAYLMGNDVECTRFLASFFNAAMEREGANVRIHVTTTDGGGAS